MTVFVCRICEYSKPLDEFRKNCSYKNGHLSICKVCEKERVSINNKKYRESHIHSLNEYAAEYRLANRDKIKAAQKRFYTKNSDSLKTKNQNRYLENKEDISIKNKELRSTPKYKAYRKEYVKNNRERINELKRKNRNPEAYKAWTRKNEHELKAKRKDRYEANKSQIFSYIYNRKKKDPLYNLKFILRSRIYNALKRKSWIRNSPNEEILGANYATVKDHIESLFVDGMSWDNHGDWHIDHIVPLASARNNEEIIKLFHYKNLQPLWKEDNLKKSDSLNYKVS